MQRHESLAVADKVENGGFAGGGQVVGVGVDGERVVGRERLWRDVTNPVGIDQLDAARGEHWLQLREPLRGLMVPLVAEEEHPDGRLGRRDCRRHGGEHRARDQERFHVEKLHSGSFMILPPCRADSCARIPVHVQLALWRALG